jgi:cytochrome c-type biogenesis protein CcmH/NrfG
MALNGLGLTCLAVGETARAEAAFRKSLRLDPNQPEIATALAQVRRRGAPD